MAVTDRSPPSRVARIWHGQRRQVHSLVSDPDDRHGDHLGLDAALRSFVDGGALAGSRYAHPMALYHIRQIGLDGHDLAVMIDFWSAALGYELDHREIGYAVLRDPADAEPRLFLQRVPGAKVSKNRAHMDIEVPDESSAVDRLVQLGARVLWREDFQTHHWTVLADPEGNEFCVGHFG